MELIFALSVPLLGTALGAAGVFFLRQRNEGAEAVLLGFAAGVMVAASVWSLLLPALEEAADYGRLAFLPAAVGFGAGFFLLMLLDRRLPELPMLPGGTRTGMLSLAVTLHNIPEGMAVGAAFAGVFAGSVPLAAALALTLGIAIQNIPEGGIISLPLAGGGLGKGRAFLWGTASGAVEPLGALLMLGLTALLLPLLPYCLAFAAGAMIYVAAEQLLPAVGDRRSAPGMAAFAAGFLVMMILDVALG